MIEDFKHIADPYCKKINILICSTWAKTYKGEYMHLLGFYGARLAAINKSHQL